MQGVPKRIKESRLKLFIRDVSLGGISSIRKYKTFDDSLIVKNESGENALHVACRRGRYNIVEYLLNNFKFDINERNTNGECIPSITVNGILGRGDVDFKILDLIKNQDKIDLSWCTMNNMSELIEPLRMYCHMIFNGYVSDITRIYECFEIFKNMTLVMNGKEIVFIDLCRRYFVLIMVKNGCVNSVVELKNSKYYQFIKEWRWKPCIPSWSLKTHRLYPREFNETIRTWFLVCKRLKHKAFCKDIRLLMVKYIARVEDYKVVIK